MGNLWAWFGLVTFLGAREVVGLMGKKEPKQGFSPLKVRILLIKTYSLQHELLGHVDRRHQVAEPQFAWLQY